MIRLGQPRSQPDSKTQLARRQFTTMLTGVTLLGFTVLLSALLLLNLVYHAVAPLALMFGLAVIVVGLYFTYERVAPWFWDKYLHVSHFQKGNVPFRLPDIFDNMGLFRILQVLCQRNHRWVRVNLLFAFLLTALGFLLMAWTAFAGLVYANGQPLPRLFGDDASPSMLLPTLAFVMFWFAAFFATDALSRYEITARKYLYDGRRDALKDTLKRYRNSRIDVFVFFFGAVAGLIGIWVVSVESTRGLPLQFILTAICGISCAGSFVNACKTKRQLIENITS